ncbi:nuclear transport factor 2 family protein [Kribbella sp. NPDC055071]
MNREDTMNQYWRAYSRHDLEAVLAYMSEDVVIQFPTSAQPSRGKQHIRPVWSMLFSTIIPDVRQEVVHTVIHGDTAACEFVETGTLHLPPGVTESAGGRPYTMEMASFFHFDSTGLIDRIRSYWDTGSFAEQIGIDISVIRSLQSRAHLTA